MLDKLALVPISNLLHSYPNTPRAAISTSNAVHASQLKVAYAQTTNTVRLVSSSNQPLDEDSLKKLNSQAVQATASEAL